MAIDIKKSFYGHVDATPLAAGAAVSEEGCGLVAVFEDGIEKVAPYSGTGAATFVGFAVFRQKDFTTNAKVEALTIPTSAPFTVQLNKSNIVVGQVRVLDIVSNTAIAVVVGAPAAGQVQVNSVTGVLTFNAAEAGKAVSATYRYNLTVLEAQQTFYSAPVNYPDPNFFLQVGVGKGKSRVFTLHFDASRAYTSASVLALGANGIVTVDAAGLCKIPGRVVSAPSANDPYLGVEFLV